MKVEKKDNSKSKKDEIKIKHYNKYRNSPMVFISGSFYGGGFYLSKNKMNAILKCLPELKKFANGDFDSAIEKLKEDEILTV